MAKLKTGRHTSAIKAWRKSEKRAARNRGFKAKIKEKIKEFKSLIAENNFDSAVKLYGSIESLLDKAAQKGILHERTTSRKKSRLAAGLNAAKSNSRK